MTPAAVFIALLIGCQPGELPGFDACITSAPATPQFVGVECTAVLLGSDGRLGDTHIAHPDFTAILRHPNLSASAIGVGGATLVDATPWAGQDHLLEAIPLVADGWLDIVDFERLEDGVRVRGFVRDLPDQPSADWGAEREVTWRVDPDRPRLSVEGADGLYLHVGGPTVLRGTTLANDDTAYGFEGDVQDLGGAIRVTEPILWVAPGTDPYRGRGLPRISGSAIGAEHIEVVAGSEVVIRAPVVADAFDLAVPAGATGVRAVATGHAPSDLVALDAGETGLDLEVGAYGSVGWFPSWGDLPPQWSRASWSGPNGPEEVVLGPDGGTLPIGPDPVEVTIRTRSDIAVQRFEAVPGEVHLAPMAPAFEAGSRLLVAPVWPSARSRTWRGASNDDSVERAAAEGLAYVVTAPEDAVGPPLSNPASLTVAGVLTTIDGFEVLSWPFTSRPRQDGWGAPNPPDAVRVLDAINADNRIVSPEHLVRLGSPAERDTWPTGIRLDRPDPDLANLQPWFEWLDGRVWLPALGPRVWVEVPDPTAFGIQDIEQALTRGNSCATTGPLLELTVDGVGSGETVEVSEEGATARIAIGSATPLDRLVLVGSGGVILADWPDPAGSVEVPVSTDDYWVAIAWGPDDWAVSSPVLGR